MLQVVRRLRPSSRIGFTLLWIICLLLTASLAFAQFETGRLIGTVLDKSGAAVVGAKATIKNIATGREVTAESIGPDGTFLVPALQPGRYRVDVSKDQFKTVAQEVTIQVAQTAEMNFSLEPGSVTESVVVTAEAGLVESATSSVGAVVQQRPIVELPLNGRNFTQLATLVPGVTRGIPDGDATGARGNAETFRSGASGGAALSVNGLRPQANSFLLDGVDNNESLVNTIALFPNVENTNEFRVQTSVAPAEYGRAGGGIVNAITRSGSNEFHGTGFWFLRNDNLDALPTFTPITPGVDRNRLAEFRRNQFGFYGGGPVVRNKLFVFGGYNGLRRFQPSSTDQATVPTALMRQGNFSELLNPAAGSGLSSRVVIRDPISGQPFAGNIIPPERANKAALNYLQAFPLPNQPGKLLQNYVTTRRQTEDENAWDIRPDWNIGTKDTMFGRYSQAYTDLTVSSRLPDLPAGFGSGTNPVRVNQAVIGETHIFSPTLLNELRLNYTRIKYGYTPPFQDVPLSANLGIANANTSPLLGGGALIGGFNNQLEYTGDFGPYLVPQNTYQLANTMTWTKGVHTFRFGANLIYRQVNLFRPNRGKGYFFLFGNGDNPASTGWEQADLLAGFVNEYTIGPPFGMVGTRSWENGFFFQDDWRVSRKLTLNLGMRYDYLTWPTEQYNRQANFDIPSGRLLVAGQNGNSEALINQDKNNWAPRIGFAYSWNEKTVIRGGYGLFYFIDRGGIDNQLAQNPPFSGFSSYRYDQGYRITLSGQGPLNNNDNRLATRPLPLGTTSDLNLNNPVGITVFSANPNNRSPYVNQWNLQVQRELPGNWVLSTGYVGTTAHKLMYYWNANANQYNVPRRFPQLGRVNAQETRGNSSYHAWQSQLERRFARGFQMRAAYTWSHAIDDGNGAFDSGQPNDIRNFSLEKASSSLDVRHRFVLSGLWEIPFGRGRAYSAGPVVDAILGGWQLNGIWLIQSGSPVNIRYGGEDQQLRPNVVAPIQINTGNSDCYIVTSANRYCGTNVNPFATPAAGQVGTLGRNVVVGPGQNQVDASLFKNFNFTERFKAQLRWEVFNVSNTPQYSNPESFIGNGNFGRITNTRFATNRQMQLGLRVQF